MGGPATSGALREELWRQELTFRTKKAEGRARGLQPWGLFGHRRLSETTRRTSPVTAPGGARPDGSAPLTPEMRRPWGAPSVLDRIPGATVAGDSLGGTWWGLYSITGGENDPGTRETGPSSDARCRRPSSGASPVRRRGVPGRRSGPSPQRGRGAAGPPGTLRSLIKSRGGGERGGRPRGRGQRPPGMLRCHRRALLRALCRGEKKRKTKDSVKAGAERTRQRKGSPPPHCPCSSPAPSHPTPPMLCVPQG